MANPCPSELVVNDRPTISIRDSSAHPLADEETTENDAERAAGAAKNAASYSEYHTQAWKKWNPPTPQMANKSQAMLPKRTKIYKA